MLHLTRASVTALTSFALVLSTAALARAANFAGTWAFSAVMVNAHSSPVCVFRQKRSALSGSCKGPNGIGSANGSVDGNTIVFAWHIIPTTQIGLAGIATYSGALGPDGVIRGTWTHSALPGSSGTFSGQRV